MLELFHWEPVGHSARVLICLAEVGARYESRYVDALSFEHFSDEFLALNPQGLLPVLKAEGAILSESSLINEFLAESFPEAGLKPDDATDAYNVQVWSKFVDYNLASSLATLGCRRWLVPLLENDDPAALQERIEAIPVPERRPGWRRAARNDYDDALVANAERKVRLVLDRLEETLGSGEWLVGGRYSIADINAFAMISGLMQAVPDIVSAASAPRTAEWAARISERPAVRSLASRGRRAGPVFLPGPEHSRWG